MKKRLKLIPPTTPDDISIRSIDWYVNNTSDFSGSVIFHETTAGDVVSMDVPLTITEEDVYYGFIAVTLSDDTVVNSDILVFSKNTKSKVINEEIYPPLVRIKPEVKHIVVDVEPPKFFSGIKEHYATSYVVKDISGNIVFRRMFDTDNLSRLTIDRNDISKEDVVMIEVRQEFKGLTHDNWSRTFFKVNASMSDIYIVNDLLYNFKDTELKIHINLAKYNNFQIEVVTMGDRVIVSDTVENTDTYTIRASDVGLYTKVKVKLRTLSDDIPVRYYEKIMRVVSYRFINPNNNRLPYSLPFNLGA